MYSSFLSPLILKLPKGITAASISLALYYSIKKGPVKGPLYELSDLKSEAILSTNLGTPVDDVITGSILISDT